MVLRVLKPMAMSNRWAAKKKLLKCPKMDMVVYQIRYRKFCSKKTKKQAEKRPIRKQWLQNEQFSQRNVKNQTYVVSQNYPQLPGVVLGIDGAQPVCDKREWNVHGSEDYVNANVFLE